MHSTQDDKFWSLNDEILDPLQAVWSHRVCVCPQGQAVPGSSQGTTHEYPRHVGGEHRGRQHRAAARHLQPTAEAPPGYEQSGEGAPCQETLHPGLPG